MMSSARANRTQQDHFEEDPTSTIVTHARPVDFHLTAFSRFFNVPVNPTEQIAHALPDHLHLHALSPGSRVGSTTVLEVGAHSARAELVALYARHAQQPSSFSHANGARHSAPQPIFVHMGVNMASSRFQLELQARNEASFSCPDETGWRPMRHAIDTDDGDITARRRTSLNLQALTQHLQLRGFDVDISKDAGRFVCNWVYFNSLKLAKEHGASALFVHVPPVSVVPIEKQIQFISQLLTCIPLLS